MSTPRMLSETRRVYLANQKKKVQGWANAVLSTAGQEKKRRKRGRKLGNMSLVLRKRRLMSKFL